MRVCNDGNPRACLQSLDAIRPESAILGDLARIGHSCFSLNQKGGAQMRKICAFAAAAIVSAALPVMAIQPQEVPDVPAQPQSQIPHLSRLASPQQEVSGRVSEVNPSTGSLSVASAAGTLKLHFPPQALRGVHKGDPITAEYAFMREGERPTRAYDAPAGAGEHQMTGTVSEVNHDTGWLQVKTGDTLLELPFPREAVRDLKAGDRITIDLAFAKGTPIER
jgi:hypothetical protein